MFGGQENFLEPKVEIKFFTVDPYTSCNRVSRPFPIWSIWQIWPLLGQKNMFFRWSRQKGKSNMDSFCMISGFFGPPELFLEVSEGFKIFNQKFCKKYRSL